jgi:hypothetical protein
MNVQVAEVIRRKPEPVVGEHDGADDLHIDLDEFREIPGEKSVFRLSLSQMLLLSKTGYEHDVEDDD